MNEQREEVIKKTKNLEGYDSLEITEEDLGRAQPPENSLIDFLVAFIFVDDYTTPE